MDLGLQGRTNRLFLALLFSGFLHGVFFLSPWFPEFAQQKKVEKKIIIELDLKVSKEQAEGVNKIKSSGRTLKRGSAQSLSQEKSEHIVKLQSELFEPSLSIKTFSQDDAFKNYQKQKTNAVDQGLPTSDWEYAPWGDGAGEFNRIIQSNLFEKFFKSVDDALFYPGILARHKIEAIVSARVMLNQNGKCDWSKTKIRSDDKHLQVFILDVLKKACHSDYAWWMKGRENTLIDMSFEFQLTEHGNKALALERQFITGNTLHFYRNAQSSVAEWHLGPFMGVFPVPVVSLDFAWLLENYERYIEKKDPMKPFEQEAPKENLIN